MEKGKKGTVFLIALLILIIACLVGYIAYDKISNKVDGDNDSTPKQEEKISEEEVKNLHDSLIIKDTEASLYFEKNVSIDTMDDELIQYLITKYGDENNWQQELDKYMNNNNKLDSSNANFDKVASVSKSQIDSMLKDIFNSEKVLEIKDGAIYGYRAWSVKYSASDNMFYLSAGTAGAEYGGLKSKMIKYEQDNDNLYVYDKVVTCHVSQTFGCYNGASYQNGYFVTQEQDAKIKNESANSNEYDKVVNYDYIFNTYENKLDTFKSTFKKANNGKYYWYSTEIEK